MAKQPHRLTRAQKQLLSKIKDKGGEMKIAIWTSDLQNLVDHGLIEGQMRGDGLFAVAEKETT